MCTSLGCSEGALAPSWPRDCCRRDGGGLSCTMVGALGLLLSCTAPKPCSPPSCLAAPHEGLEGHLFSAGTGPCGSQLPGGEGRGGEVKPKAVE